MKVGTRLGMAAALALCTAGCASGQTSDAQPGTAQQAGPAVAPMLPNEDPNALVREVYRLISGGPNETRDWDAFRRLHAPNARLSAMVRQLPPDSLANGSRPAMVIMSVEDFVRQVGPELERDGFWEEEVGHVTERYGHVAHVMSAYVSRRTPDGEPFDHGVNSIQLVYGDGLWWVHNVVWDNGSRGAGPIPERYRR